MQFRVTLRKKEKEILYKVSAQYKKREQRREKKEVFGKIHDFFSRSFIKSVSVVKLMNNSK